MQRRNTYRFHYADYRSQNKSLRSLPVQASDIAQARTMFRNQVPDVRDIDFIFVDRPRDVKIRLVNEQLSRQE